MSEPLPPPQQSDGSTHEQISSFKKPEKLSRTSSIKHVAKHFPYWVFPLISALAWFVTLWALLIIWLAKGRPHYASMESGQVAYISDIGASSFKPLFIIGASVTSFFFFLTLLSMRRNHLLSRTLERVLDILSLLAGLLGCLGLILLSVYDTLNHILLHRLFLLLFMLGIVLSAIFTTLEYRSLGKTFTDHPILRYSYNGKRVLLILEVLLSIAFGACLYKRKQNPGAILEWVIAFLFTAYLVSFFFDLRPSARTKVDLEKQRVVGQGSANENANGNSSVRGVVERATGTGEQGRVENA